MGKIIGFFVGYLFFREIGAVFGLLVGHYIDQTRGTNGRSGGAGGAGGAGVRMNAQQRYFVQQAYLKATFLIMGHIAKADGIISKDEIRAARTIMKSMNLSESQKREAVRLFTQGKQPNFNVGQALDELYTAAGEQPMLYRMFIDIQFRAATADGQLGPVKQKILDYICRRLGFNYTEFANHYQQYTQQTNKRYQQSQSSGEQRQERQQQQQSQQPVRNTKLENAHKLLGSNKNMTDPEVKKRYRKMMSQNHPDKLISKGLPEEMIKLATQKTQEIKAAYDTIKLTRANK